MKEKMKYTVGLLLLLLLPLVSGCNDTDDVEKIFTGKTWKLTYITVKNGNKMIEGIPGTSIKVLNENASFYTITFNGMKEDDIVTGTFGTRVISSTLNGNWSANGKDNKFTANVKYSPQTDPLAKEYLNGLTSATSYSGDEKNLYLHYKSAGGQQEYTLVFHTQK